jgi:hypothetical protein
MNRRIFIQAAALFPAAASQILGRMGLSSLPASRNVAIEADIADPEITDCQIQSAAEVHVRLFELNGDAGQLSGACLHICDRGEYTSLSVSMGQHFLGFAERDALMRFFEVAEEREELDTSISLRENLRDYPYRGFRGCCDNGGFVTVIPGTEPELRVIFGGHCFGILGGHLVAKFLKCVRQRCEEMEAA